VLLGGESFFGFPAADTSTVKYDPEGIAILMIRKEVCDVQTNKRLVSKNRLVIYVPSP